MPPSLLESWQSLQNFFRLHVESIIDRNEFRTDNLLSWNRSSTGILREVRYESEYQRLVDQRDFTCLFRDRSFAQVYYEYSGEGALAAARLAFYPAPERIVEVTADGVLAYAGSFGEDYEIVTNTSHIRYDYDCSVTSHSKSHLQLGAIQELRLTTAEVFMPFLFLDSMRRFFDEDHHADVFCKREYAGCLAYDKERVRQQIFKHTDTHYIIKV